jgi:hypothetical protein
MMTQDEDPADPLLAAIGALRHELVGWIDSRLGPLRERQAAGSRAEPRPAPPEHASPPQTQPQRPAATASPEAGHDPRRRLDALARHLGERLRPAGPAPPDAEREQREGTD